MVRIDLERGRGGLRAREGLRSPSHGEKDLVAGKGNSGRPLRTSSFQHLFGCRSCGLDCGCGHDLIHRCQKPAMQII